MHDPPVVAPDLIGHSEQHRGCSVEARQFRCDGAVPDESELTRASKGLIPIVDQPRANAPGAFREVLDEGRRVGHRIVPSEHPDDPLQRM